MNERIKNLVDQVGGDFWQRLEDDVVKEYAYVSFDPPEKLEKLVELIVKECCSIADEVERADTGMFASKYIRAHFGVEE